MSDNKPLLIIGNGFDLHLGLKSSFNDFFQNEICKINDKVNFEIRHQSYQDVYANDNSVGTFSIFDDFKFLKQYRKNESSIESLKDGVINRKNNISASMYYINYKPNNNYNFWNLYFKFIEVASNERIIESKKFENWNDIESQINYFLSYDSEFLEFYVDYYNQLLTMYNERPKVYNEYVSKSGSYLLNSSGSFDDAGIIRLMSIYLMLYVGWEPDKQNVYDFLFQELQEFENQFLTYLTGAVNDLTNYKELAQKFANELVDAEYYKLINFNYTDFYAFDDPDSYNIHSTLSNHPIFGIGDNDNNGLPLSNKPYYMFTKTYRIMTLASNNVVNNTLSPDVNQIIFYGHSLSDADYAYFQSLFDYYDIYNSDVQLLFKYSIISDSPNKDVQRNINSIYKLINRYGADRNQGNLLNKLIMGNRLKLDQV